MRRFPYPLKTKQLTVYGKSTCPYCQKMKEIVEKIRLVDKDDAVYYDIETIINKGNATNYQDFREKMKLFIKDYPFVPLVFVYGDFIGGHDDYVKLLKSVVNPREKIIINKLLKVANAKTEKATNNLLKELEKISRKQKLKINQFKYFYPNNINIKLK